MTLWFVTLAVLGIPHIVHTQEILLALSPTYALAFVLEHPLIAFVAMGGVVLAITGAEALYAEMGHFGARAIRQPWYLLVLPALTLNHAVISGAYSVSRQAVRLGILPRMLVKHTSRQEAGQIYVPVINIYVPVINWVRPHRPAMPGLPG